MKRLGRWLCRLLHGQKISRPVNGQYTCLVCLREFAVNWGVAADQPHSKILN